MTRLQLEVQAGIEQPARRLIADPEKRSWIGAGEHAASSECVFFCDVIRRGMALLLEASR